MQARPLTGLAKKNRPTKAVFFRPEKGQCPVRRSAGLCTVAVTTDGCTQVKLPGLQIVRGPGETALGKLAEEEIGLLIDIGR
jgi:hypothetical protein